MNQSSLLFFAFVAMLAWLVNLRFIKIRAWEKSPQEWIVKTSWLATLFLALAISFQIWAVKSSLQIHLFLWYLAYITVSFAIYFSYLANSYQNFKQGRKSATLILMGNLSILSYLYMFHISKLTWIPDHHVPKNTAEWGFLITLCLYGMILGGVPILDLVRDYQRETAIPTRARYITLIVSRTASTIYFLVKIVMATVGYFAPSYRGLNTLLKIHDVTCIKRTMSHSLNGSSRTG